MVDLKFEINFGAGWQPVNPPTNWKAMQIEVIWVNDLPSASLQSTEFEWVLDEAKKIQQYRENGLTGNGPGIYEGLPLRISFCQQSAITPLEFVIDLADERTRWECDKVTAPIKESARIDWLNDIASSFSFSFLASLTGNQPGRINPATDYKRVPYAITEIPDYTQAMLISISLFVTVKELLDVTTKISQMIAQLSGDTATAVATVGLASGSLIATIAIVVLYVAYLFLIVIILVEMIQSLVDNIIQLRKHKLGMRVVDHFQKACNYLGIGFSSSILQQGKYQNATIIPAKNIIPSLSNPLNVFDRPFDEGQNFPNNGAFGHYDSGSGTFAEFIKDVSDVFNAEIKMKGGFLYFEPKNSWNSVGAYQLPNTGPVGYSFNYPDPHGTNASELASNYFLIWQTDPGELNTIHRYRGTSVQAILQPNISINKQNLLFKNSKEIRLNFALAKRKEYLTRIEKFLDRVITAWVNYVNFILGAINGLINAINTAISFFGGNPATIGTIPPLNVPGLSGRVGWMALSNDTFSVPKMMIGTPVGNDWELSPSSETDLAAITLFNSFHARNLATRGNQQLKFTEKELPFCCSDFQKVINNNVLADSLGRTGKFNRMVWDLHNDKAINVDYSVFLNFTNNLTEKIIIDGK